MVKTVSKDDLIELGFKPATSAEIIRRAKYLMVKDGFDFYSNKRLGRVPITAVEKIIGYNPFKN